MFSVVCLGFTATTLAAVPAALGLAAVPATPAAVRLLLPLPLSVRPVAPLISGTEGWARILLATGQDIAGNILREGLGFCWLVVERFGVGCRGLGIGGED